VDIDLTLLVGKFCLNGSWYNVEYEVLHLFCLSRGCCGHAVRHCTSVSNDKKINKEIAVKAWLLVNQEGYTVRPSNGKDTIL